MLDTDRRELRCGESAVPVQPQVFDLLVHLIHHRDRVVTKDDLLAAVRNGRIVSESTMISRINAARRAIGDDGDQQRLIRTIPRKGVRFVGTVREEGAPEKKRVDAARAPIPELTFCRMPDGVRLAVATAGEGAPLVRAAHWITQIEAEWHNPLTAPLLHHFASYNRFVRYDTRGTGLSDRNVPEISFARSCDDLAAVIDSLSLDRFALFGQSGGAAVAIDYAVRNPDRVTKLILCGGYAQGRNKRASPQSVEEAKAFLTMFRSGWGDDASIFWRAFSAFFVPSASPEQLQWFLDLQKTIFSPTTGIMVREAVDEIDVVALLPHVRTPTIIFHALRDKLVPFEQGRLLAANIVGAKFVPLDTDNHFLLADELAWQKMVNEIDAFLEL